MSIRLPVSPPGAGKTPRSYKCYVDSNEKIWEVFWKGTMRYPDIKNVPLHPVEVSGEVSAAWSSSKLLDFGSNAVVRISGDDAFPVLKIAHPNNTARRLIQHEFELMKTLAECAAVAKVDFEPLVDEEGIFGFRLERLWKIDFDHVQIQRAEVQAIVNVLHKAGYCHGDLSPSNVMKNEMQKLVLIDFSFAGLIGQTVPSYIPDWVYGGQIFDPRQDEERLEKYFSSAVSVPTVT